MPMPPAKVNPASPPPIPVRGYPTPFPGNRPTEAPPTGRPNVPPIPVAPARGPR